MIGDAHRLAAARAAWGLVDGQTPERIQKLTELGEAQSRLNRQTSSWLQREPSRAELLEAQITVSGLQKLLRDLLAMQGSTPDAAA